MKSVKAQIIDSLDWFLAKLKSVFTQKSEIVNNCVSTSTNVPLAAAQGKALSDSITALNSNLSQQINELNSNLYSIPLKSGSILNVSSETLNRWYFVSTSNGNTNFPSGVSWGFIKYLKIDSIILAILLSGASPAISINTWNESSWGDWVTSNMADWDNISNKPSTFPPSNHTHDDRYYTEAEANTLLNNKASFIYGTFGGAYEFVAALQGRNKIAMGYFQDSAGWTPVGGAWWNVWAIQQNDIESEYDVGVNVIIARGAEAYFGYLGKSDGGIGPRWFPLFRQIPYQSIGSANGVTGNLWSNGSVVTVEVEGGLTATINAWSDMTLGYVPEGLQPPTTCVFPVSGATTTNGVCVQISNDRRVAICNRSNNTINASNWEVFTMCTYTLAF